MLADDEKRKQYGKDGQALVRGEYGWGAIAERTEGVYEGIISKLKGQSSKT
jgi:glycosyltransferase involved in cell wall biosynthesis